MKRYLAVLVLVAVGAGCVLVALPRTPNVTVLQSLRTIAVIPMESAGPGVPAPRSPLFGSGPGAEVLQAGAISPVGLPVLTVYAIYLMADEVSKAAALPNRTPIVERELQASRGMLSVDLAKAAAETLQRHAGRTIYLVDGYVRLPGVAENTSPTDAMNEMNRQIKDWYREEVASTDYSGLGLEGLDAILEVGIASHQHDERGRLLNLGIMVRLVDPATKQVLGRRAPWPQVPRPSDPVPAEEKARAWGREKVTQCLKELGLLAE